MNCLKHIFTWPGRLESNWIGKDDPNYQPTANRSLLFSVIAIVIGCGLGGAYAENHGLSENDKLVYAGICIVIVESLALLLVAILERQTWQVAGRKAKWFVLHGLVLFFGGALTIGLGIYVVMTIVMFVVVVHFIKVCLGGMFSSVFGGGSSAGTGGGSSSFGTSSSSSSDSDSRDSRYGVEATDMFNEGLKHRNDWGPDEEWRLVEESIYGNVYENSKGERKTVKKTDSFGHPTELE